MNLPETPKFRKQSYEKGQNKKKPQKEGAGAQEEELPSSPTKVKKGGSESDKKRKQQPVEENASDSPASPSKPAKQKPASNPVPTPGPDDKFMVGDDAYHTFAPALKGKKFASMEEFAAWMKTLQ
jgi:hypothetical protein